MPEQKEIEVSQVDGEDFRGRVALLERLKEHFSARWRKEYLLELRNSYRLEMKKDQVKLVIWVTLLLVTRLIYTDDFGSF